MTKLCLSTRVEVPEGNPMTVGQDSGEVLSRSNTPWYYDNCYYILKKWDRGVLYEVPRERRINCLYCEVRNMWAVWIILGTTS